MTQYSFQAKRLTQFWLGWSRAPCCSCSQNVIPLLPSHCQVFPNIHLCHRRWFDKVWCISGSSTKIQVHHSKNNVFHEKTECTPMKKSGSTIVDNSHQPPPSWKGPTVLHNCALIGRRNKTKLVFLSVLKRWRRAPTKTGFRASAPSSSVRGSVMLWTLEREETRVESPSRTSNLRLVFTTAAS